MKYSKVIIFTIILVTFLSLEMVSVIQSETNISEEKVYSRESYNMKDLKIEIQNKLKEPINEFKKANKKAIDNFAFNIQTDILALKENVPQFVNEITSYTTFFKFAKAYILDKISSNRNHVKQLVDEIVNTQLIPSGAIEIIIHRNLETLKNDIVYNRNRLYSQVKNVIYMKLKDSFLSENEVESLFTNLNQEISEQTNNVIIEGVMVNVLKEIGSVGISILLSRVEGIFASWFVREIITSSVILASSEGAAMLTSVFTFTLGTGVYFLVDHFMTKKTRHALSKKANEMIEDIARGVVYGNAQDGLFYKVDKKVYELTARDVNYINSMLDDIEGY